jgi:predicted kinase
MVKVVAIYGIICSGKTTFMQQHNAGVRLKIDIGDIVRDITQTDKRIQRADLDVHIISNLTQTLLSLSEGYGTVLIAGIRQLSIVTALESVANVYNVLLDVPLEVSMSRYENRMNKPTDGLSWSEAISRDNEIGLQEVINYIRNNKYTNIIKNYTNGKDTI